MNAVVLTVKYSYVASTKYTRQGVVAVSEFCPFFLPLIIIAIETHSVPLVLSRPIYSLHLQLHIAQKIANKFATKPFRKISKFCFSIYFFRHQNSLSTKSIVKKHFEIKSIQKTVSKFVNRNLFIFVPITIFMHRYFECRYYFRSASAVVI